MVYAVFFCVYQIRRHPTFQTYIDLTNVEQTIWNTLHGRFLRITTHPTTGEVIRDFSATHHRELAWPITSNPSCFC